jgi:glucosamine-6-phosphate deaminase
MITTREMAATTGKRVRVQIAEGPVQLGRAAAEILRREWLAKEGEPFTIGLPTGNTPIPFYGALLGLFVEQEIDFRNIHTFNLDEYVDLPPWHANSYRSYMEEHLFRFVNLPRENIHFLNGMTRDWKATCRRYEETLRKWGGIDLQFLGIGRNGHIAFNEPGTDSASRTRMVRLSERTLQENARLFSDPKEAPEFALTVGIQTILEARKIVLLALGSSKANAVYESLCEPHESRLPASFLQTFPGELIYVLDKAAATDLPIPSE